jgi:alpha-glucosidase
MDWSLLGFTLKDQYNLVEGLKVVRTESQSNSSNDTLALEGAPFHSNSYNELTLFLEKHDHKREQFAIVFRAYNNGIALSYFFPENEKTKEVFLQTEETQFDFYGNNSDWRIHDSTKINKENLQNPEEDFMQIIKLPASFVSQNGIKVSIFQNKMPGYPEMKMKKRIQTKPEFSLQIDDSGSMEYFKYGRGIKTAWRSILISGNDYHLDDQSQL